MTTTQNYRPIRRPSDCWPKFLLDEYRRLARLPVLPVKITPNPEAGNTEFRAARNVASPYFAMCSAGQDYAGLLAAVCWLKEGPKIADVTEEQYQAMSQVEVRLRVQDFLMPYPTILVNMPPGKMHQYVILHRASCEPTDPAQEAIPMLIGVSISYDNQHDIVTVVRDRPSTEIEESLARFYGDVTNEEGEAAHESLRVSCNMVLAMTNLGCEAKYVFPAEVEEQRKHVAKGNRQYKDGTRASDRLAEQPTLVVLDREVKLYHREDTSPHATSATGHTMPFHWRRGHWRKARVGIGRAETKLVFVRPCMVRADLMVSRPEDTTHDLQRRPPHRPPPAG